MKRKLHDTKVELFMPSDMAAWLKGHAITNGVSLSEYIRKMIREKQAC